MSENPKIYRNPKSGSMRFTGTADFVDSEGNIIESRTDFNLLLGGISEYRRGISTLSYTVRRESKLKD